MNYANDPKMFIVEVEIITSLNVRLIANKLRNVTFRQIEVKSIQFQGSLKYSKPITICPISNERK